MADENLTSDLQPEVAEETVQPIVKVAPPESRFLFVDVAALRAKQLRRGARPRLEGYGDAGPELSATHPLKAERVAMEEVRQGLVEFDIPEAKADPGERAVTLAEVWNLAYGAIVGIGGIVALLLALMIGLCLALDWTKLRPTLKSRTVKSLDETVGAPIRYLPPNAPRGPVDQLARSIRATS